MRGLSICILLAGLSNAVQVYLNAQDDIPPSLNALDASFILSRHLGLDSFETAGEGIRAQELMRAEPFVGKGSKNGLLLTIDEEDARGIIPSSLKPSFELSSAHSLPSLSSLISTYLHRARHVYPSIYSHFSYSKQGLPHLLDIFSASSSATEPFIREMSVLSDFLDHSASSTESFAALELRGLSTMAKEYGRTSEQYKTASAAVQALLQSVLANPDIHLALVTYSSTHFTPKQKRVAAQPPQQSPFPPQMPVPQEPISGVSTCFKDAEICTSSTYSCSGRGECVSASKAGKTCFMCACSATTTEGGKKTQHWVGDACERKDISGPFVLLAGTSIALVVLIVGSISLVAGVGSGELPSTLTGGAVAGKKD